MPSELRKKDPPNGDAQRHLAEELAYYFVSPLFDLVVYKAFTHDAY